MDNANLPLVSILIPTYNQKPDFLRACILSAINQTYKNIEVIISNNWSTEASVEEVINEFLNDRRLVKVKPDTHLSMVDNFVFTANQAKGEYISILSSDDLLEVNAIQLLVEALLRNPGNMLAFGEIEKIEAHSSKHISFVRKFSFPEGNHPANEFLKFYIKRENVVWVNGNLINKKKYHEIGGAKTDGLYYHHDTAFLFKWIENGNSITYVNKLLGKVRVWEDENQKADNNREKKDVHDILEISNMVLKSEFVAKAYGKNNIANLRRQQIKELAYYWCIKYIRGEVTKNDFYDVKSMVNNNIDDYRIKVYFMFCQSPLKYVAKCAIKLKHASFRFI